MSPYKLFYNYIYDFTLTIFMTFIWLCIYDGSMTIFTTVYDHIYNCLNDPIYDCIMTIFVNVL